MRCSTMFAHTVFGLVLMLSIAVPTQGSAQIVTISPQLIEIRSVMQPDGRDSWAPSVLLVNLSPVRDDGLRPAFVIHVENEDGTAPVGFTIDTLNIHATIPAGQSRDITVAPKHDGIYPFYSQHHSQATSTSRTVTVGMPRPHQVGWIIVSGKRGQGKQLYYDVLRDFSRMLEQTLSMAGQLVKGIEDESPTKQVSRELMDTALHEAAVQLNVLQWGTRHVMEPAGTEEYLKTHWLTGEESPGLAAEPGFQQLYRMLNEDMPEEFAEAMEDLDQGEVIGVADVEMMLRKLRHVRTILAQVEKSVKQDSNDG